MTRWGNRPGVRGATEGLVLGALLAISVAAGFGVCASAAEEGADGAARLIARHDVAVVDTSKGRVQGFVRDGIYTYRGIPYANAQRFMPPEEVDAWDATRQTLSYGNICPQPVDPNLREPQTFVSDTRFWPQSENCQNLNVWTPGINDGKKRPVMVWLHGGGFFSGSSMELPLYDGTHLAQSGDVVVVSVNHRLNVLGFLDLSAYGPEYASSGDVGMMDIVSALQWVHREIASFGGDPSNVTIFGQSGGGAKVATLMTAPSAKGLFHKAVIESGAPGGVGPSAAGQDTSRHVAELTFRNAGIASGDVKKLQSIPYAALLDASQKALMDVSKEMNAGRNVIGGPAVNWSPVVDGDFLPAGPFANGAPAVSKGVPLLIGSTLSEFSNLDPRIAGHADWTPEQVRAFLQKMYGDKADAIYAAYEKAYPELAPDVWLTIDTGMRNAALYTAGLKAEQGDPVYSYVFAWRSPVLDYAWAAGHSSELAFVFDNPELGIQSNGGGPLVDHMASVISAAWINFARTGNPNTPDLPKWPKFGGKAPATMIFDADPDVRKGHDAELMRLLAPGR